MGPSVNSALATGGWPGWTLIKSGWLGRKVGSAPTVVREGGTVPSSLARSPKIPSCAAGSLGRYMPARKSYCKRIRPLRNGSGIAQDYGDPGA